MYDVCVCTFRAVWGAHRCPACSPVACRPAALPPRQVDATLPDPPSEARRHRDPIRAETRERLSSCGCEELGRTILDEFQTIGRHVGRPLTGFTNRPTLRLVVKSNRIESSRLKILQYLARLHGGTLHRPRANLWRFGIPPPLSLSRKGRGWVCGSWLRLCDISPRIFGCARHG